MTPYDRRAWMIGAAGLAVAALGWLLEPARFHAGWLAALVVFAAWPLGSIALLLTHALTGGRWGDALRPALRLGVCVLPLLLPALLPLAIGLSALYPWARPDIHLDNGFYLNVPFFAVRGAVYLFVWFVLAALVLRGRGLAAIAPIGLFLLAVTVTFAVIDTEMSLDPHFTSSIYGMVAAAGMGLLALSAAVLLTLAGDTLTPELRADLGKLILALAILWIYLDFMQLLIVWQSDLATEAPWYLARARGLWGAVWIVVALGHFVLPFFLLLSPAMQRSRRVLTTVAALLVVMAVLRGWWTVLPSFDQEIDWIDIACMLGFGGLAIGVARGSKRYV